MEVENVKIAGLGDIMLGDQPFCFGFGTIL